MEKWEIKFIWSPKQWGNILRKFRLWWSVQSNQSRYFVKKRKRYGTIVWGSGKSSAGNHFASSFIWKIKKTSLLLYDLLARSQERNPVWAYRTLCHQQHRNIKVHCVQAMSWLVQSRARGRFLLLINLGQLNSRGVIGRKSGWRECRKT